MKHGSLFSGIGGFDYAAQMMGWENVFHCEKEPFCKKVLTYYWPNAISHDDIKQTDFSIHRGSIDVLTGGFPCQPYSTAGKRKGKEDDRHLWPEMLRAIREIQPRWIVGENVRGLISWNEGLVFDQVQVDLEAEGYEVYAFLLPACGVNAPHRRERIWFIAYSDEKQRERQKKGFQSEPFDGSEKGTTTDPDKIHGDLPRFCASEISQLKTARIRKSAITDAKVKNDGRCESATEKGQAEQSRESPFGNTTPNTSCEGLPKPTRGEQRSFYQEEGGITGSKSGGAYPTAEQWKDFPTQSPVCGGDDGLPRQLDGITFSRWRRESIKGYGNAIVPQVALQIFKAVEDYQNIQ